MTPNRPLTSKFRPNTRISKYPSVKIPIVRKCKAIDVDILATPTDFSVLASGDGKLRAPYNEVFPVELVQSTHIPVVEVAEVWSRGLVARGVGRVAHFKGRVVDDFAAEARTAGALVCRDWGEGGEDGEEGEGKRQFHVVEERSYYI